MSAKARLAILGVVLFLVVGLIVSVQLGALITPTGRTYPGDPISLILALVREGAPWPFASWFIAGALIVAAVVVVTLVATRGGQRHESDKARRYMAKPAQTVTLREKARTAEAARLHPSAGALPPGQKIGKLLGGGNNVIYQGWRDMGINISGTGRGKTSAEVIPHMIAAPGAAFMTGNKVDGVTEVLAGRKDLGEQFVFDPQRIYRREPGVDFVFNPLDHVETVADAKELAAIFEASSAKITNRGGDPQFDEAGRGLLAYFFLAAALEARPLTDVFEWLSESNGQLPMAILKSHGKIGPVAAIAGVMKQPERTSGSVFATAQRMAAALADDDLMAWTDSASSARRFRPDYFITGRDTLILLSKEGEGSGGAILTALVRSICKHAERAAQTNGGRIAVPLVGELDECANIVRWPELPSLYSFYGSLGIILTAYFQSWKQGAGVFGQDNMQVMWDSAACRVYGGGSGDEGWLKSLSALIGEHDEQTRSTSTGRDSHTTSTHTRRLATLDVAALSALPEWRAVVFSGKGSPVMIETLPWFRDPVLTAQVTGAPAPKGRARNV